MKTRATQTENGQQFTKDGSMCKGKKHTEAETEVVYHPIKFYFCSSRAEPDMAANALIPLLRRQWEKGSQVLGNSEQQKEILPTKVNCRKYVRHCVSDL